MNKLARLVAASFAVVSCQGSTEESSASSGSARSEEAAVHGAKSLPVPKPVPGGDFFPDSPTHRAGIIHQFYPVVAPFGDGPWAEPNGMTDFKGFVAQVFMGGDAVDNHGNHYLVDVDNRVYRGEYIGTNGEHARGTFCEI